MIKVTANEGGDQSARRNASAATAPVSGVVASDVSVAIAAYNGAKYLPALLDSIVAQTVTPKEIVCADDASTDDTVNVLERYAQSSPVPIKIIRHTRNVGIIENFLSAFRATSGAHIAYCDQDDVWLNSKLELCLAAFDDPSVSFVSHASLITNSDLHDAGEVYYKINGDWRMDFPAVAVKHHCWGHQVIFDRTSLEMLLSLYECDEFRQTDYGTCFDYGIPFAASLVGALHVKADPLVKFRRHEGATTDAGVEHADVNEGFTARIGARAARVAYGQSLARTALRIIDCCEPAGAKAIGASRRAYETALALFDRRARLAATDGFLRRCAQFPGVVMATLFNNPTRMDFRIKELTADFLTVFFARPNESSSC